MPISNQILSTLKDIPILSSLSDVEQKNLAKQLKEKKFGSGEDLMKQGDIGSEFFLIVKGKCKVIVTNSEDKEVEIAQLEDGDYCGEQALIHGATRTATVRAIAPTRCLVLNQKEFSQIIEKNNNIQFAKRDAKRNAISAELLENIKNEKLNNKNKSNKSQELKLWLMRCVKDNILFSHLDEKQRELVIQQMYRMEIKQNEFLIKQGEEGNQFFVVEKGSFVITVKNVGQVDSLKAGRCVGELALLYNAPRAASVQALSDSVVWCVDRSAFRRALMEVVTTSSDENIEFLKKCQLMKPLLSSELQLIDDALEQIEYKSGDIVFKLGDIGDKFYLVKSGNCTGIAKDGSQFELGVGSFFGERALLTNEVRAATIKCVTDCIFLTLTREDFNLLLGPLEDIMKRNLQEYEKPENERKPLGHKIVQNICKLSEFNVIGILGKGAFGTVKLVVDPNSNKSYALKAIRKNQIVELGQQSHILNEKKVMQMLDNKFLVNLRNTYKDDYKVYFLLEVCLGGELFTILRKMRSFDETTTKFYAGCVIEAFDYMHERDIVYRDLKPENLVLTDSGYLKVTDFGFAKIIKNKTFTLCGTPDYLAPEIVTGQGHGLGVDWWTLGILIYEMLASFPPFFDDEPMMTYRKIIQGKFKFPRYLSAPSKDIVSKFLKPKPTKRLGVIKGGAKLIRSHPWFKGFDWNSLRDGTMKVPIKTKVSSAQDISNFDHFTEQNEDLEYKGDPDLGWDREF